MLGVAHPGFSSLSDNRKLFGVSVYFSISRFFIFVRSGGQRLICRARVHRAMLIFAFDPPPPPLSWGDDVPFLLQVYSVTRTEAEGRSDALLVGFGD